MAAASTSTSTANSIIPGGCNSPADCSNKVHNGDAVTRNLYTSYHITAISINQAVPGTVTKSGLVIVNGKTVATHALSFGRTNLPGSTPIHGVFRRPTSVSFTSSQLPAFVHMTNGRFDFAVIQSCGNLVIATPVAATPVKAQVVTTPSPTPVFNITQTQTQSQAQVQSQTQTPPPAQVQSQAQAQAQSAPAPIPTPQPVAVTTPLPDTGASTIGLGGLTTILVVAAYYRRSRRGLRFALLSRR